MAKRMRFVDIWRCGADEKSGDVLFSLMNDAGDQYLFVSGVDNLERIIGVLHQWTRYLRAVLQGKGSEGLQEVRADPVTDIDLRQQELQGTVCLRFETPDGPPQAFALTSEQAESLATRLQGCVQALRRPAGRA